MHLITFTALASVFSMYHEHLDMDLVCISLITMATRFYYGSGVRLIMSSPMNSFSDSLQPTQLLTH